MVNAAPTEGTPLGSVTALGLEGKGKAPEIKPMGFLLKYDPPTIILEYAATQLTASQPREPSEGPLPKRRGSKGRMRLAEAIAGSKNFEAKETEQFFRLHIKPSRGWFNAKTEKDCTRDARRIAVKLQRRYDRFMGKDKVDTQQIADIVAKLMKNVHCALCGYSRSSGIKCSQEVRSPINPTLRLAARI